MYNGNDDKFFRKRHKNCLVRPGPLPYIITYIMPTLQHQATLSSRHVLKEKRWTHGTLEHRNTWSPRNTRHINVWKSSIKNSVDCSIYLSGHRWLNLKSLHQLTTILELACKQASSAGRGVQSLSTLLMRDICETGIYVTFRLFALWSLDNFWSVVNLVRSVYVLMSTRKN